MIDSWENDSKKVVELSIESNELDDVNIREYINEFDIKFD